MGKKFLQIWREDDANADVLYAYCRPVTPEFCIRRKYVITGTSQVGGPSAPFRVLLWITTYVQAQNYQKRREKSIDEAVITGALHEGR